MLTAANSVNVPPKPFFINSKKYFLTYPKKGKLNCKKLLFNTLKLKLKEKKAHIERLIVSYETSDDKHPYKHFHVFIKFDRKVKVTDPRYLDILDVHGQYEGSRNEKASIAYVTKDKDFLSLESDAEVFKSSKVNTIQLLQWLINFAKAKFKHKKINPNLLFIKANKLAEKYLPMEVYCYLLLHLERLKKSFIDYFGKSYTLPSFKLKDFNVPNGVLEWKQSFSTTKTLLLIGKSGSGKTELLKALYKGRVLLVRHIDQLKNFDKNAHDAIQFDDMNFRHWPRESLIHLLDLLNDSGINVKGSHSVIPAYTPRMITSNLGEEDIFPNDVTGAIERRLYVVNLTLNADCFLFKGIKNDKKIDE